MWPTKLSVRNIKTRFLSGTGFFIIISNFFEESSGDLILIYPLMPVGEIRAASKSFQRYSQNRL
jgi:hypothetical protein